MDNPISRRPVPLPYDEPAPAQVAPAPAAPAAPTMLLHDYQLAALARIEERGRELALIGWAV